MSENHHPPTVRLRKVWIGVALIGGLSLAMVILGNLYQSASLHPSHPYHPESHQQTFANGADTKWYHDQGKPPAKSETLPTGTPTASSTLAIQNEQPLAAADPDRLKAMGAAINSNQLTEEATSKGGTNTSTPSLSPLKNPISPYVIQAGTLIPGILITGINSDLPGQIVGQVRSHVYDSIQGRYVLIPQGSKLIGVYDAKIIYGQERVLVAWQRLILPNGQSMALLDMAGVDNSGYAGFCDGVNAHYGQLFSSALLMSVLGTGAYLSAPQTDRAGFTENPMSQALSQSIASNVMTTASALTAKNLTVQPTLEIRPGFTFNIAVTQDMVFPKEYIPWNGCH